MTHDQIELSTTLDQLTHVFRPSDSVDKGDDPALIRLIELITSSREEIPVPEEFGLFRGDSSHRCLPGGSDLYIQIDWHFQVAMAVRMVASLSLPVTFDGSIEMEWRVPTLFTELVISPAHPTGSARDLSSLSTTIGLSTQIDQIGLIIEHVRRQHEMQLFSWFCPAPLPRRRDEAVVAG